MFGREQHCEPRVRAFGNLLAETCLPAEKGTFQPNGPYAVESGVR